MSLSVEPEILHTKRRLSRAESAVIVDCLKRWMEADKITSTYEAALFVDISRATLGRWLKGDVRIPFEIALRLLQGLVEFEKPGVEAERAVADLATLLRQPPSANDRLLAAFRLHRVRFRRAMAAIAAAGFRVVPTDAANELSPVSSESSPQTESLKGMKQNG